MTDPINFRALCVNLLDCLEKADWPPRYRNVFGQWASIARVALAEPVAEPPAVAEGEVAELVAWLKENAEDERQMSRGDNPASLKLDRAAELLNRHAAMENLAADAVSALRYIEQTAGRLYGVGWDRVFDAAATLQPAHALPLPAPQGGEVTP